MMCHQPAAFAELPQILSWGRTRTDNRIMYSTRLCAVGGQLKRPAENEVNALCGQPAGQEVSCSLVSTSPALCCLWSAGSPHRLSSSASNPLDACAAIELVEVATGMWPSHSPFRGCCPISLASFPIATTTDRYRYDGPVEYIEYSASACVQVQCQCHTISASKLCGRMMKDQGRIDGRIAALNRWPVKTRTGCGIQLGTSQAFHSGAFVCVFV